MASSSTMSMMSNKFHISAQSATKTFSRFSHQKLHTHTLSIFLCTDVFEPVSSWSSQRVHHWNCDRAVLVFLCEIVLCINGFIKRGITTTIFDINAISRVCETFFTFSIKNRVCAYRQCSDLKKKNSNKQSECDFFVYRKFLCIRIKVKINHSKPLSRLLCV